MEIDREGIEAFCRRWGVREFSLFGSILREDFGSGSDVDVLVTFSEGGTLTFESYVGMCEELAELFGGREIDLVETGRLADPYRRHEILRTREVVYSG